MSLYQKDNLLVTDAAVIRAALPQHSAKRLARLMDLRVRTAKHWLYNGPSSRRRRELALKLLDEIEREIGEKRSLCRVLAQWRRNFEMAARLAPLLPRPRGEVDSAGAAAMTVFHGKHSLADRTMRAIEHAAIVAEQIQAWQDEGLAPVEALTGLGQLVRPRQMTRWSDVRKFMHAELRKGETTEGRGAMPPS